MFMLIPQCDLESSSFTSWDPNGIVMELRSISMNYIEVDLEKKESLVETSLINTSVAGLQAHICYNQEYSHNIFESI